MECRAREGASIDLVSLAVNGFLEKDVHDTKKKSDADIFKEWLKWREQCVVKRIAGQNIGFDLGFIGALAKRIEFKFEPGETPLDLMNLYTKRYRRESCR